MDQALFHPGLINLDAAADGGDRGMSPFVELTFEGPLARIALKRADKLNALDGAMVEALADARARSTLRARRGSPFSPARARRSAPAATSRPGAGCRRLTCGATGRARGIAPSRRSRACARRLIAALTGHAFGGGLELAAVADIRVAESGVKLGLPESGLGMAPGWSGTQRLVRRFGSSVVRRMALAGRDVHRGGGARARASSTKWRAAGEGLARADAIAADIARRGPVAVQIVKAMINAAEGEDRDAPIEGLAGALTATTQDLAEGVAAFRDKRAAELRRTIGGYLMSGHLPVDADSPKRSPASRATG